MKKLFIILLLLISFVIHAQTTKYVAPDGVGNNGSAGDIATPWATLAYAITQMSATDTIYMQVGTHTINELIEFPIGVSLRGAGETSIITTTTITDDYQEILRLTSNPNGNGNQSISYLKFDGNNLVCYWALTVIKRNNVKIHHCTFVNFRTTAVSFVGTGGTETEAPSVYCTGNKFYNNDIDNCAIYDGNGNGALTIGGQEGMLIYNNDISQTGRAAGTNGLPIKVWGNGGWTKGLKIYNNILFKGDASIWDFAIEGLWMFGTEIYGNTITGSIDINHIAKDTYAYGLYIHNNTLGPVANTAQNYLGVILEFEVSDVIIQYNLIRHCYVGVNFVPRSGNTIDHIDISTNIFDNLTNGGWGIKLWQDIPVIIGTLDVYNNVFYSNPTNEALYGVGFEMGVVGGGTVERISVINNIFVNFTLYWGLFRYNANCVELNTKNNIYYQNGNSNTANLYSSTPQTYNNSNNIIDNPDFITDGSDYHLQSNSPAKDAGLNVGLTNDYSGHSVPQNTLYDIGAYEYGTWIVRSGGKIVRSGDKIVKINQ